MFYFDNISNKKILKSDKIQNIQAFFTTRETIIKSKNDDMQNLVDENKRLICNYLNLDIKNLVSPSQTHSANIDIARFGKFEYPETDALILAEKNLGVFLNFADCTPVILYDKKQNIGAIAHAGWRGTAQKITPLTVQKLINEFNSNPDNISALIGPAIGMCCYNVG